MAYSSQKDAVPTGYFCLAMAGREKIEVKVPGRLALSLPAVRCSINDASCCASRYEIESTQGLLLQKG
jgi:hypothetical protein